MISLHIHLAEYKPFNGRSYIKLPDSFQRKKEVLISRTRIIIASSGV